MSLRRTSLTLVTVSAVALSAFSPVAHAQSSDVLNSVAENITSSTIVDEEGNPVDGAEQWPGSVEGSSMLSSGEIPEAPSIGSSGKTKEDDGLTEEEQATLDEWSQIPVIGSVLVPPSWVEIPFAVIQALGALIGFGATAGAMALRLNPDLKPVFQDYLTKLGINVNA
ncbi:hypothetical protein [Corynebacterium callunae]|uniref:hypothetical protein n=1 Tax=Corynebacterium callunae TaxID=1721 RepID=UPI001FFEF232|nr:hypothetical protein [Corynebacterium callunae]MCK2199455.1 hypothetical protein [Corynebacterium callunae]